MLKHNVKHCFNTKFWDIRKCHSYRHGSFYSKLDCCISSLEEIRHYHITLCGTKEIPKKAVKMRTNKIRIKCSNCLNTLPESSPLILLGMHRSGTSLFTGMLAQCGIYFGRDLDRNHESKTFKGLNEFLINSTGGNWDYPSPVTVLEKDPSLRHLYLKYIKEQLKSPRAIGYLGILGMLKQKPIYWGWKDPRNSFTLGLWREIFPDCKVIIIERHGMDVALSLLKRREEYLLENIDKFKYRSKLYKLSGKRGTFVDTARCYNILEGIKLWAEYTNKARIEANKITGKYMVVKYEDLLLNPVETLKTCLDFVGIALDKENLAKICSRVNPKRAFAYRYTDVLSRLSPNEKDTINSLLIPHRYTID